MMNILRVYNSTLVRNVEFAEFVKNNEATIIEVCHAYMSVAMKACTVYFRVVNDMEGAHQLAGMCFQFIDFIGDFDKEVKNYLRSRIRG